MPKSTTSPDIEQATRLIAALVDHRNDQISIKPGWVATEVLATLGAKSMLKRKGSAPVVYQLAHLQCRQLARQFLGRKYDPKSDAAKGQHTLWPEVQDRYPSAPRSGRDEPEYIKVEHLTAEDWKYNVDRMEADVKSRSAHLDAFKRWGRQRFGKEAAALVPDVRPPVTH